jgi:hypothetical protein
MRNVAMLILFLFALGRVPLLAVAISSINGTDANDYSASFQQDEEGDEDDDDGDEDDDDGDEDDDDGDEDDGDDEDDDDGGELDEDDDLDGDGVDDDEQFTATFNTSFCRWENRYFGFERGHPYFVMEPGWQVVLEGEDEGDLIRLETTVLDETELVNGVMTRVIEEREYINGELFEVSRNFYAICRSSNDIYYFGEDVSFFENGELVSSQGEWRAGVDGATAGIIIPGAPLIGARYQQENAPGVAEDRAEVKAFVTLELNGQTYPNTLILEESNPLDPEGDEEIKLYAPGIGNVVDEELELVSAGFIFTLPGRSPVKK